MNVLLTNDDGVGAKGIEALVGCFKKKSGEGGVERIAVVAPDRERSASGHAITMYNPIRVKEYDMFGEGVAGWSVDGTPADCVKLAMEALLDFTPDIVISGINSGPNLGTDILYSGTVSAAIEGILYEVPSIAVSLCSHCSDDYAYAAEFTYKAAKLLLSNGLPGGTLLNINVPAAPREELKGVRVTRLGTRKYTNAFDRRIDPWGNRYYWLHGELVEPEGEEDSDWAAVRDNYVSVTPIHFDFTDYKLMKVLENWDLKL